MYYMAEWVPQSKRGWLKGGKGQLGFELHCTCYGLPRGQQLCDKPTLHLWHQEHLAMPASALAEAGKTEC